MDESHSLLLNEEALQACAEQKRPIFFYEWLRYLDRVLPVTQKADLKSIQPQLQKQLESRLTSSIIGAPTRQLLAKCIARMFSIGDSSHLFAVINACNDTLKAKDDSAATMHAKLTALACLRCMYETMGRLVGRSYEETFTLIQKWLKTADSQSRAEIMLTLRAMVSGLGSAAAYIHKDVHKILKHTVTDRAMHVRVAAVQCLTALVPHYPPLYTTELEAICTLSLKALDSSTYEVRREVAFLLAKLFATALSPPPNAMTIINGKSVPAQLRSVTVDDALYFLSSGFLRGGIGGFLKTNTASSAQAGGSREIRVGLAMAYIEFCREMGAAWLEKTLAVFCRHILDLAMKCGILAYTSNPAQSAEALMCRRCISFILRSTIGAMLSENSQLTACKYLGALIADFINSFDYSVEPGAERQIGTEAWASGYAITVALLELSSLTRQIGSAVTPLFVEASGVMEPVFACLLHPILVVRAATAWCLRCLTLAVPSQLTPLIDRCLSRLEHMKASADAISGYSTALAALIAAAADCKLGIPNGKPKQVLHCADELLRTATQQARLTAAKIDAGWMLMNALVELGPTVIKEHVPRLAQMWRAAFPRSAKEAEAEKGRGDAFSWQCALVSRAGALSVMIAVAQQPELADDETIKSMLLPIECSLIMMSQVGSLIRSYGSRMRQLSSVVRVQVYRLITLLHPRTIENLYVSLLRELVADITLSDNSSSATMCSTIGRQLSTGAENILLSAWFDVADEAFIENQLQLHPDSTGSLEEDLTMLISASSKNINDLYPEPESTPIACLNAAVNAYAKIFPLVASKHKVQITEHFAETIKSCTKQPQRQQALQLNVLCATAGALKTHCDMRGGKIDNQQLQKSIMGLVVAGLGSTLPTIRAAACETLARLAQAVGDPQYVASMAQFCFDKLTALRDAPSRAGYALALGCLHRHAGSLGSGQHLNTGVSILLALAQDASAPLIQCWSLVSLALIAETGGGMFRGYVEPVLSGCLKLLLVTPLTQSDVIQSIGKLLSALITCVGPELAIAGQIEGLRGSLLAACAIMFSNPDPLVRTEAIYSLQQMHLFAPRYVDLHHLVVDVCTLLDSPCLFLRKAAVSCLRQLAQKEAREVREHAQVLVPQGIVDESRKLPLPDTGLEGALFAMLDTETDPTIRAHIQETLQFLVQATGGELLNQWLTLCKDILATSSNENSRSTLVVDDNKGSASGGGNGADNEEDDEGDDDGALAGVQPITSDKRKVQPRWPSRVFAISVVRKLMQVCDQERAHIDLTLARELQIASNGRSDYLVLHLSDLIRMSFMGATSDNTELRLAGLHSLQDVINRFSAVPEPEFPGHVILEQFQAQVGAALRPAFTEDTPSHITAAACQVCSTWIGSGVARDLNDLRRVHQLLVSSLAKLRSGSMNSQLYSESAATLEKLSILKAWAEVFVTATEEDKQRQKRTQQNQDDSDSGYVSESLLSLVRPELDSLVVYWLAALKDAALLALPAAFGDQLKADECAFFKLESADACREYYQSSWAPLLLASAIWLKDNGFVLPQSNGKSETTPLSRIDLPTHFYVMLGLAMEVLASRTSLADDSSTQTAIRAISTLLTLEKCQLIMMEDAKVAVELVNVLHRLVLTRDSSALQRLCIECAQCVLDAALCSMRVVASADIDNGNAPSPADCQRGNLFKGDADEELKPGALTYALLELAICLIVRQMPQVNVPSTHSKLAPIHFRPLSRLSVDNVLPLADVILLIVRVPLVSLPQTRLLSLPIVLHILISFLRECSATNRKAPQGPFGSTHLTVVATASLQALHTICSNQPTDSSRPMWLSIMRSGFYSLLQFADDDAHDACLLMLAAVVMASTLPSAIVTSNPDSVRKFVGLLARCLRSPHPQVVCKCLQSLSSLLSRRQLASLLVQHLGATVFSLVKPWVVKEADMSIEPTENDLSIVSEAVKTIECIVNVAETKKRCVLLCLLVQSLGRLLRASTTEEWRALGSGHRRLHDFAFQRLNALAVVWSGEVKKIMSLHPELRTRLERAVQLQSQRTSLSQSAAARTKAAAELSMTNAKHKPAIKLTMDFNSAFS